MASVAPAARAASLITSCSLSESEDILLMATITSTPPGSVPASFRAILSARTEEAPIEILANGPACTNTGVPSRVCMRLGLMASFMMAVRAPAHPRSSQVIGSPDFDEATTIFPSLSLISFKDDDRAKIAITSEATVMSKPVSLVRPFSVGAWLMVIPLSDLSFRSSTLFQVIVLGSTSSLTNLETSSSVHFLGSLVSRPSFFTRGSKPIGMSLEPSFFSGHSLFHRALSLWVASWNILVSSAAASKLLAMPTA
ncbi:hypothetical protein OGATHE_006469 [Ogataea polymorpha]|uniref:Uncharacterized protein n=1 Tax=Ogataea polymorpha TaxID=460523 RepID=A0A9P8SY05_9ASCO|nr:hypothetical protein OGATHE_006469 [Ogataea polymorpha]